MDNVFALTQKVSYPLMRIAMGIVLLWIGALKFVDPSPVVGLLGASLPFLASSGIVYVLGGVEIALAVLLFAGIGVRYVGLALLGLFAGTLLILAITPKVVYGDPGFPVLSLAGEFLLKDLVLFAASVSLTAMATARQVATREATALRSRLA